MYSRLPIEPELPETDLDQWLKRPRVGLVGVPFVIALLSGLLFFLLDRADEKRSIESDSIEVNERSEAEADADAMREGRPEKPLDEPAPTAIPPGADESDSSPGPGATSAEPDREQRTVTEAKAVETGAPEKAVASDAGASASATATSQDERPRLTSLGSEGIGTIERIAPRDRPGRQDLLLPLPVPESQPADPRIEVVDEIDVSADELPRLDVAVPASPRWPLRTVIPNSDRPFVFGRTLRFLVEISKRGEAVVRHEELDGAPRRTADACRWTIESADWIPAHNENGKAVASLKFVVCPF